MGQRASNTATVTFNETEVDARYLLGEENKGFKLAMMTLDRTRPGVAAMATGIARAAFEFATAYSKERVQFGVPIAMHQAIQFMIADMATKVHLSRLATWNSRAVLLDQGTRNTLESSHAKRFAADTAMEVTTDAVQVYGGYGFIKEYPVEKLMRDAKIMQLYEGTSQIQRLVIARETLLPRRVEEPAAASPGAQTAVPTGRRERPVVDPAARRRAIRRRSGAAYWAGCQVPASDAGGRRRGGAARGGARRRRAAGARGRGLADPLVAELRRAGCCGCSSCTSSARAVLRQPAHRARRRGHRRAAGGQPEHDVPAAAPRSSRRASSPGSGSTPSAARGASTASRDARARPSATASPASRGRGWTPWPPPSRAARRAGAVGASRPWAASARRSTSPRLASAGRGALVRHGPLAGLRGRPQARRLGRRATGRGPGRAWSGTRTPAAAGASSSASCAYEPRGGQEVEVEDEKVRGTQRVAFAPHEQGVVVTLELRYTLKQDARRGARRRPASSSGGRSATRCSARCAASRSRCATSCAPPPALRAPGGRARAAARRARWSRRARSRRAP